MIPSNTLLLMRRRKRNSSSNSRIGKEVKTFFCSVVIFLVVLFVSVLLDVRTASSDGKKAKTQFVYRTTEEVIEEATKGGVHKMARDYR